MQVIEELFAYWNLEDADETLEELEDALIVSLIQYQMESSGNRAFCANSAVTQHGGHPACKPCITDSCVPKHWHGWLATVP